MTPMKTEPWAHQIEDLEASWKMPGAAIPWPPRLGKSKVAIDTAARLADAGLIDAAVVVAPNGVHMNWSRVEIPTHWPLDDPMIFEWRSQKKGTVAFESQKKSAIDHPGFVWLSVNVEAIATSALVNMGKYGGAGYLEKFVKRRRCLLIVDESHKIKNYRAKRTKAVMRISRLCPFRRNLSGTPVSQGPFDLWSQYNVLDPSILGTNFTTFRLRYGVFRKMRWGTGPSYDELVEYRNLDELNERIAPYTFHRVKEECLDLPDRTMSRAYFELPKEHRRVYEDLRIKLIAQLDSGETITSHHALTKLLRLQQVSRGHVKTEEGDTVSLGGPYPAIDATMDLVEENDGKAIVWCRFVSDVDLLVQEFTRKDIRVIRCDGSVPSSDRPDLIRRFRDDPGIGAWVGTLATGGEGIDLGVANLMVFYSHGFDLVQRLQGLERNFGSSQKASKIGVVDLVAADTVDEKCLSSIYEKEDLASRLTGAKLREIIS